MSVKIKKICISACRSRITVIAAILIVLYAFIGFLLAPFLIERYLPGMLGRRIDCDVSLRQVKVNPFALSLEAADFQINEPSGRSIAGFQRLYVNFQLSSLFRWALTFQEIAIDAPYVNAVIDADGKVNLARLAVQDAGRPVEAPDEEGGPIRMLIYKTGINQGRIDLTDNRQSIPALVSFYPLNISLADISTLPEREGPYTLTATGADGAVLQWSGDVSLQPLRSEGSLAFKNVLLKTPWQFARSSLNIAPPEGSMGIETRYILDMSKDTPIFTLLDLNLIIHGLGIRMGGDESPLLNLPEITGGASELDLIGHRIDSAGLSIKGGSMSLLMDKDGVLNIQRLVVKKTEADPVSNPSRTPREEQAQWVVNISNVSLQDLAVDYIDESRSQPVISSIGDVRLSLRADINTASPELQVQVNELGLTLNKISMGYIDASRPALQAGSMILIGGTFDLLSRSVSISGLELSDGIVDLILNSDKSINLTQLFAARDAAQGAPVKASESGRGNPWRYQVKKISISGFKTGFTDMNADPRNTIIDLEDINLVVSGFDGKSPSPFETGMRLAQGGELTASGSFDPSGPAVEARITVKDLYLPIAQPYLSRTAGEITVKSGLFSTSGALNRTAKGGLTYKGQVGVETLNIIENSTKDTLVGWEQLKTPELRFSLSPDAIEMEKLTLTGLEGKLIISEDKSVNVVEAFKTKGGDKTESSQNEALPVPAEKPSGESFPVKVSRLNIERGKLDFADLSLRPQFGTKIHELNGVIINISSSPGSRTQVELEGRVDEYGSNSIKGEINTFDPKEFTDISMIFKNVEMTNLTPYSGKFAGYKIDSGKLSLDLQYKINNSQLLGDNKIIIDTLTLGEKVDSPDAVKVPLRLAVAILKDADGVIDIGLPVSGNLDDPEFRYGPLIWKALVNLLTKIVTSPFKALGALFGGDDEILNTVNFEAGKADVPPPEQEKLAKLLDALRQRPQLKLIVTGRYNTDSDGQAIRQLQIRRAVAEATGSGLAPGEDPGPVDFSSPQSQERLKEIFIERYGTEAFDALNPVLQPIKEKPGEKQAKKKADAGEADATTISEDPIELARRLFADLVEREQADPAALIELGDKRGQSIVSFMTAADRLPPDRAMVKPPEPVNNADEISAELALDAID